MTSAISAAIITDTSCLILLDKINELELLGKMFEKVITTQTIALEFGKPLPQWITIQNPRDETNQLILQASLDKGEASAIALAMEQTHCLLIIDELKGRKLAKQLYLKFTGTLGLIAEAKLSGHIPSVRPLISKIKQTNFRLTERLENIILKRVGEQ